MTADVFYVSIPEVMSCDIGGERVLLHLDDNTYFTVNATASALWLALAEPKNLSGLVDVIVEEFDVSPEECRADIALLLEQMKQAGIIRQAQPAEIL